MLDVLSGAVYTILSNLCTIFGTLPFNLLANPLSATLHCYRTVNPSFFGSALHKVMVRVVLKIVKTSGNGACTQQR